VGKVKNYSHPYKFLFCGYTFDQQRDWLLRREELRKELEKEFQEIFNAR